MDAFQKQLIMDISWRKRSSTTWTGISDGLSYSADLLTPCHLQPLSRTAWRLLRCQPNLWWQSGHISCPHLEDEWPVTQHQTSPYIATIITNHSTRKHGWQKWTNLKSKRTCFGLESDSDWWFPFSFSAVISIGFGWSLFAPDHIWDLMADSNWIDGTRIEWYRQSSMVLYTSR